MTKLCLRPGRVLSWAWSNPLVALSALVIVSFCLAALLAPWIAPFSPNQQALVSRLKPPLTGEFLMGTDQLGRDVFSRLLHGARLSISIGIVVMVLTAVLGVSIGLVAGYFGGIVDTVIMRIIDILLAFPFLLLAIALVAVLGQGVDKLVLAMVLSGWPGFARPVRGEILQLREREYVMSAHVLGASPLRVMVLHMLPNLMPTILVLAALDLGSTILSLAALSFLGLGVSADVPTWGGMLAQGRNYVATAWWLSALPGAAIFLLVLSSNLIGDWVRDYYDPRSARR